jgi:hypothetical protein
MLHQQNAVSKQSLLTKEGGRRGKKKLGTHLIEHRLQRDFNPINNRPDTNHRTNSIQFSIGATFETANIETHSFSS